MNPNSENNSENNSQDKNQDVLFYILGSNDQPSRDLFISKLINKINTQARQADVRLASQQDCERLDLAIWQFKPSSFIPHSIAQQVDAPIQLWNEDIKTPCQDVLLNLHPIFPELFSQYRRTIEVLDQSDELIKMGRSRWKQYKQYGIEPTIHKL